MAFVEYDLVSPQPTMDFYSSRPTMRGIPSGGASRGLDDLDSDGPMRGVSAYSMIGAGAVTQDRSVKVTESGQRKMSKINLYLVGAMVVNTNDKVLEPDECQQALSIMRARAEELNQFLLPYKAYFYSHLSSELNGHLKKYSVSTTSDIFEHSILRLASIDEPPRVCRFEDSKKTPQFFFMDLGLSSSSIGALVENLQTRFGADICQHTPEFNRNGLQAVRFSLEAISRNMPAIKESMDAILSDARSLSAYQHYSRKEEPQYNDVVRKLMSITSKYGLSAQHTDCVEMILLHMFGCTEELKTARFREGDGYLGKMLDTHFCWDISEAASRALVDTINQQFPSQARFIRSDARVSDKGPIDLREIAIESRLLSSREFLALFEDTLNKLLEEQPLFIEKLRIQSGTLQKSSEAYARGLEMVAERYKPTASSKEQPDDSETIAKQPSKIAAQQRFFKSLRQFSSTIASTTCKQSERREASEYLRRSIAFFESEQSGPENQDFKKTDKREIKEALKSLGLRS